MAGTQKTVLLSCVGTSDPVRGAHDGGLLHIMRHYRPTVVCAYFTPEITALDAHDHRYEKMFAFVKENWEGYAPEFYRINGDVADASDLDALDRPLRDAIVDLSRRYPDATILINLSSGTPQMQMILSQLALDLRYHARGVQVKNHQKKSGDTDRTNAKDYDPELELLCNLDEQPDAPNRCEEPELLAVRREMQRTQIKALLEKRDYGAISEMKNSLPSDLMALVRHLAAREQLQDQREKAKNFRMGFSLYPVRPVKRPTREYPLISEYYLMMRNLQRTGRYTDFVLRLNPFIVSVQTTLLGQYLGFPLSDILSQNTDFRKILSAEKLRKKTPALWQHLEENLQKIGKAPLRDSDLNIFLCNRILEALPNVPEDIVKTLEVCETLNLKRNQAAHQLSALTDADIVNQCGWTSKRLMDALEHALPQIYPECDPQLFTIYDRCGAYILERL